MRIERLVSMINDIAAFFASEPAAGAAARGVESHISRFWDPRMRRQLMQHYREGGAGLSEVSRSALMLLMAEAAAAPARHANEAGTGADSGRGGPATVSGPETGADSPARPSNDNS
jgi:formate dehydrogenase subunit delta